MKLFSEDRPPTKAISRNSRVRGQEFVFDNELFTLVNGKMINMEVSLCDKDDIRKQVDYESDEEYFPEIGKLRYLRVNHGQGLESLIKFLNYQAKLKTFKNIEMHEIEFQRLQFRVEKYGTGTTIERILKVKKNDV